MTVTIKQGDVREILPTLAADSFDCICTSPPYYGLRDYGTAVWEGGDPECEHKSNRTGSLERKEEDRKRGEKFGYASSSNFSNYGERWTDSSVYRNICGKCGARRIDAQIGLEPTLDEYLETIVAVCRELRRVLKPSGVVFLNLGDSYCSTDKWGGGVGGNNGKHVVATDGSVPSWAVRTKKEKQRGLKPKDLCLVPERLGIALQADGWWVRSRIVWEKKNPMPESATDRPTSAHETVWMLTKAATYFWDAEAVKEAEVMRPQNRFTNGRGSKICSDRKGEPDGSTGGGTRNLRNVWSFASHPFPGAHFATMPAAIAERCIKAGSSERGCCPACGKPWVRVVEKTSVAPVDYDGKHSATDPNSAGRRMLANVHARRMAGEDHDNPFPAAKTIGWYPSCKCDGLPALPAYPPRPLGEGERDAWEETLAIVRAERKRLCDDALSIVTAPARILDPFAGSGTTGLVADRLGRDATLIDLNVSYASMALNRIKDDAPLFAEVAAE